MKCLQSMITSFIIKVPSNDQKWNAINQLRTTSALVNQWQVLFNLSEFLYPHLTQSEIYTKCLGGRDSDANKYFFLELLFLTKNEIMNIMTRYSAWWLWIRHQSTLHSISYLQRQQYFYYLMAPCWQLRHQPTLSSLASMQMDVKRLWVVYKAQRTDWKNSYCLLVNLCAMTVSTLETTTLY